MHTYVLTKRDTRHEVWNSDLDIRVCPSLDTPCKQHHHYYQIRWMERVLNRTIESFANNSWLQIQLKNVLWLLCVVSLIPHIMLPFFLPCYFSSNNYFYLTMLFSNLAKKFCSRELLSNLCFCPIFSKSCISHRTKNIKTVYMFSDLFWYLF